MRRLVTLVIMICSEAGLVLGLHLAGRLTGPVPWHALGRWLLHGDTEDVVVAVVRLAGLVVGWWLVVSSIAYLAARACRLDRASLALGRLTLPVVRRLADSTVAATVMLSTVGNAGTAGASAPLGVQAVGITNVAVSVSAGPELALSAAARVGTLTEQPAAVAVPAEGAGFPVEVASPGIHWHVVRRGDSLWRLAQEQLGDAHRYPEIWQLNRGRRMNDGRCFRDPDHIRPGWVLAVPTPNLGPDPVREPSLTLPAPEPPPIPAAPAAPTPNEPTPSPVQPPASGDRAPPPPDRPGEEAAPTPTLEQASGAAPSTSPVAPGGPGEHGPAPAPSAGDGARLPSGQIALAGMSGLVAAIVILSCRRLARRSTRVAPGGQSRSIPDEQERIETRVRAIAEPDAARWIDAALRLCAGGGDRSEDPPVIRAVRAGSLGVELLLAQPHTPAPPGFLEDAGGWQWRLALDLEEAERRAEGLIAACPALVEVGRMADGPLLVNLEALDRLEVGGEPGMTDATIKAVAAQLACAPWASGVETCILGSRLPLEGAGEIVHVGSVAEAIERSRLAVAATTGEEPSKPAVLVSTRALGPDEVDALDEVRPPGTPGFVTVAPAPLSGATGWLRFAADGTGRLEPIGLDLTAAPVWPDAADQILSVLEAYATESLTPEPAPAAEAGAEVQPEREGVAEPEEAPDAGTAEEAEHGSETHPEIASASLANDRLPLPLAIPAKNGHHRLEVLVLGPIALSGTDASLHRHRMESQLLVRLAVVGEPYSAAKLREDLYPSGFISDNTWNSLLWRARKRFGVDPQGHPLISPTTEGCLSLSPWVRCDMHRFQELVSDGKPEGLRTALELIRGESFDVLPNGYDWVTAGLVLRTQDMITAAAVALVEYSLSTDDHDLALWAADQGLRAAPESEPLRLARIRALVARGDPDAARHTLEDIETTARDLGAEMLPETAEIVQALLGQQAASPRKRASGDRS